MLFFFLCVLLPNKYSVKGVLAQKKADKPVLCFLVGLMNKSEPVIT